MSHIPASKMPHAKPHDDHGEHADAPASATPPAADAAPAPAPADPAPLTAGPEIKPAVADPEDKAGDADAGKGSSIPYVAIAAVGALAIGGIVAALALRQPKPAPKKGKGKKDRSREG